MNIKMTNLQTTEMNVGNTINFNQKTQMQVAGLREEEEPDATLSISEIGKLKAENNAVHHKESGITSAREKWENDDVRNMIRKDSIGNYDLIEIMRLDEPETYEKYEKLDAIASKLISHRGESKEIDAEYEKASFGSFDIWAEWFDRRCMSTGWFRNPVRAEFGAIEAVENFLSDDEHDTSINMYGGKETDMSESIWRFKTKYNVLLSKDMLDVLKGLAKYNKISEEEKKNVYNLVDKMEQAVGELREVEKKYSGDLEFLRFGVRLSDDGNITYHANYRGCENQEGIMADSADELLKILSFA